MDPVAHDPNGVAIYAYKVDYGKWLLSTAPPDRPDPSASLGVSFESLPSATEAARLACEYPVGTDEFIATLRRFPG